MAAIAPPGHWPHPREAMNPQRVACKFFVQPDPTAPVDLHPFIGLFHRFIQEAVLPGLLIDVADYAHVPEGPGVLLIGHDVDYGLDLAGGRAGLLTTRKRLDGASLVEALGDTLLRGLRAIEAIEKDGSTGLRFDPRSVTVQVVDRLAAPNHDDGYAALAVEVAPVLARLYGEKVEVSRANADDPRKCLALRAVAQEGDSAAALADRLEEEGSR
jgi:hypothetical protein